MEKARTLACDVIIFDLEDAVADDRQGIARDLARKYLQKHVDRKRQQLWVRINPLDHDFSLPISAHRATEIRSRETTTIPIYTQKLCA